MGNSLCMPLWACGTDAHRCAAAFPKNFLILESLRLPAPIPPAAAHLALSWPVGARNRDPRLFQRCRMCRMCRMPSPADAPHRHIPCASTKMGLVAGGCSYVLVVVAPKGSNARDLLYIDDSRCIGRFPSLSKGFRARTLSRQSILFTLPICKSIILPRSPQSLAGC